MFRTARNVIACREADAVYEVTPNTVEHGCKARLKDPDCAAWPLSAMTSYVEFKLVLAGPCASLTLLIPRMHPFHWADCSVSLLIKSALWV